MGKDAPYKVVAQIKRSEALSKKKVNGSQSFGNLQFMSYGNGASV